VREARRERWLPDRLVTTLEEAARFVDGVQLALVFPAERIEAPSLYEAVAGEDATPFEHGMGEAESLVWEWKDELPNAGLSWYGKFLYRRGSFLSPALLAALYPGRGRDDDHRTLGLTREAHELAQALRGGPMTTAALRQLVGDRSRYERAIGELHRQLLVTSAGVDAQRSGWPAAVIELTCRTFTVGKGVDPGYATHTFVRTMVVTTTRDLARAYGWPVGTARAELDRLVGRGAADLTGKDTYTAR
jgi:hypothetical protein